MKVLLRNPRRELEVPAPHNVAQLLTDLDVVAESVLVIRNDTLATQDEQLHEDDVVEIRPVVSGGAAMKCRRCREPAVIDVRRHNAGFCADCFLRHCREQVRRAIEDHDMIAEGDRVLVAVSGGKDSLGLWQLLRELGYDADGLYVGLGIGEYSDTLGRVRARVRRGARMAAARSRPALHLRLRRSRSFEGDPPRAVLGVRAVEAPRVQRRRARNGYDVLATGHNLDDEAAVLLGNVLRWDVGYLGRQHPVLPEAPGFVRKVKPLVRLGERELAAYCVLTDIDYIIEECPMAAGNRHLGYKELLNQIEERSPGTKAAFLFSFLERGHERFAADAVEEREDLHPCPECGSPTPAEVCAFCRLQARATRRIPVTVET